MRHDLTREQLQQIAVDEMAIGEGYKRQWVETQRALEVERRKSERLVEELRTERAARKAAEARARSLDGRANQSSFVGRVA